MSWIGQQWQGAATMRDKKNLSNWKLSHPGLLLVWKFRSWELKGYFEKA